MRKKNNADTEVETPTLPQVTWQGEALLGNNDTNNAGRTLKIVTRQLLAHGLAIPLQPCNPRGLCFCRVKCEACTVGSISLVSTALPTLLKITSLVSVRQNLGLILFSTLKHQHSFEAIRGSSPRRGEALQASYTACSLPASQDSQAPRATALFPCFTCGYPDNTRGTKSALGHC